MADEQQQKKNQCTNCYYFSSTTCLFDKKPITANSFCHVELYELIPACGNILDCTLCQHFTKTCEGDREHPAKVLKINPHYGQYRMVQSKAQKIAVLAGKQSGKTEFAPVVMHRQMEIKGSGDYIAASSSFPLMDKKLVPIYRKYFIDYLHIGQWQEAKKKMLIDGNGIKGTIFFGSAKNADSLESSTAKFAHLDEAGQEDFTLESYEAILGRVSHYDGAILFTTTLYNFGWLKTKIYDEWAKGNPDYEVIQWDSCICPGYSMRVWETRKRELDSWKFDMQYRGIYTRPAGMIYSDFDEKTHLIKPFTIPHTWPWHVGIDPGAVHTALVWVAEEPGANRYYIVHSYLDESKITTKEHVKKAMRFHEYGRVVRWVGAAKSEEQVRLDWSGEGIHVRPPEISDVESGIDKIITLLKDNRLFIFNNEENTKSSDETGMSLLEEITSYSREVDENGKPTDRIANKNKYHKLDACRYVFSAMGTVSDYSTPVYFQNNTVPVSRIKPDFLKRGAIPQF